MMLDLNALSLAELKRLEKDIAKAIAGYEARKRAEALAEVEAKAKELGFKLGDLTDAMNGQRRGPGKPKYRHLENPEITWTGRGRKPAWFAEHIAAGRPIEDLEI